jgi:hypothetical protein
MKRQHSDHAKKEKIEANFKRKNNWREMRQPLDGKYQ